MITQNLKRLLRKLNAHTTRSLEAAAGFCTSRTHYEVTIEHVLLKLLEDGSGDIPRILSAFDVDSGRLRKELTHQLDTMKSGNASRPAFSPLLLDLIETAWVIGSVQHDAQAVRSGFLLAALIDSERVQLDRRAPSLNVVSAEALRENFSAIVSGSSETSGRVSPSQAGAAASQEALSQYTNDLTERAANGHIDPIFGRNSEIRQIVDILGRRRKNNALLVGEAGTGKTAVVEGLALRIANGDVPDALREVSIRSLDMGTLQAGAGMKGEFEERLKTVLREVTEAPTPTLLFIDEAHTLIGAGGQAGTGDAANLLKPMLTRGELRVIAATTWSEYKKHIEKDPALERRFQRVQIDEPSADEAAVMLRGLKHKYEDHHGVQITDDAVEAVASLSDRYVSGRQLPDKAVDLLDTSAARVRMTQTAKPAALDDVERRLQNLKIETDALKRDISSGLRNDTDTLREVVEQYRKAEGEKNALETRWESERDLAQQIIAARRKLQGGANGSTDQIREEIAALQADLNASHDGGALVHPEVNADIVAEVVSDWTGIPIGNMIKDEAELLLELDAQLRRHLRGQDEAIGEVSNSIRAAKAGMGNPDSPLAVFLLVGPSGVGKTETARQLARILFGGERFLTTINMSEYQESHTVSQLKGSPPGYVGYGEGGVLTEAVRQRPYSVILLDEVEKAHIDAMEMFYQVFDKGFMRDGEGREIDFRNTIIMMTSNIGSDVFLELCEDGDRPTPDVMRQSIHPHLVNHFQAALLARMRVVPYYPLHEGAMRQITQLKLNEIGDRLDSAHAMAFDYTDSVIGTIAERCTQVDAGARNIDYIIDRTLLPEASQALLSRMTSEDMPNQLTIDLDDSGAFAYRFDDEEEPIVGDPLGELPSEQPLPDHVQDMVGDDVLDTETLEKARRGELDPGEAAQEVTQNVADDAAGDAAGDSAHDPAGVDAKPRSGDGAPDADMTDADDA